MPKFTDQALMALWLENQLTDEQRNVFEQKCLEDETFAHQVDVANQFKVRADAYQPESVPAWSKAAVFETEDPRPRWQWRAWPAVSMAMSALAMVMVLTGAQVRIGEGEMTLAFSSFSQQPDVESIVERRVTELREQQSNLMSEFAALVQQQQMQTSNQLTEFLLTSSRQERREDFAELIRFINQQRNDDQQFYARQLNKLQRHIYAGETDFIWPTGSQVQE